MDAELYRNPLIRIPNRKLPPGMKGPRKKDMDRARENLRNWRVRKKVPQ